MSVINCRLEPQSGLEVTARVFGFRSGEGPARSVKPLWQRTAKLSVPANAYREAFAISSLADLAPLVFVKLELRRRRGRLVSDNFYWLRGQGTADYKLLQELPLVKLENMRRSRTAAKTLVHVRVANPTEQIGFFIQAALTNGGGGEEILPVFWDDNYFSLLPGETREVTARIARRDLGGKDPCWKSAAGTSRPTTAVPS